MDMINNISEVALQLGSQFSKKKPSGLILLGDRGEMLGGAIAAAHLKIPIVHIHGGERSGTLDESIRHAISKLSHYHFTSTNAARDRLIKMGEDKTRVFRVGAPGLDEINKYEPRPSQNFSEWLGLSNCQRSALVLFHPDFYDNDSCDQQLEIIIRSCVRCKLKTILLAPNLDAGSENMMGYIQQKKSLCPTHVFQHLDRSKYLWILDNVDVFIGNSSSGIIESASFGTPFINLGKRQQFREQNNNTFNCDIDENQLVKKIFEALNNGNADRNNIYENSNTDILIADLLEKLPLKAEILNKLNAY